MSDIHDWLVELGLADYAAPFAENGVDFAVLPKLTLEDLKDIGVKRVGEQTYYRWRSCLKSFDDGHAQRSNIDPPSPCRNDRPQSA